MSAAARDYDFIIAGSGAAGLSLAYRLVHSPLREQRILLVDRAAKDRDDRTWCFWTDRPSLFDGLVVRTWRRLQVVGGRGAQTLEPAGWRYQMIRGLDFYRATRQALAAAGRVDFVQGAVERIDDGPAGAHVIVDGQPYRGRWVFDSRFQPEALRPDPARYYALHQHFQGWEIGTPAAAFDPQTAILLDFRTSQDHETRFFYVLPLTERRALVEHVRCTAAPPCAAEARAALRTYLSATLGLAEYRIVRSEGGSSPLTDQPFPRRAGPHVMTIGIPGGRIKPSTGYAFTRIQRDSAAIVRSLLRCGHPFAVPPSPRRYRFYDSALLGAMAAHGEQLGAIFGALFARNPPERIFRFLDERTSLWEDLLLLPTLPAALPRQALRRLPALGRI